MITIWILFLLFGSALIFYVVLRLFKNGTVKSNTDSSRPPEELLPKKRLSNDTLVLVNGVSHDEIRKIITGFCNMYNKETYPALPRLYKISEIEFAITFPYDIDFVTLCYFVNYLTYPLELKTTIKVEAWITTETGDAWISERSADQLVMLYVPEDDEEYDNVFMTTRDGYGFKLEFNSDAEKEPLDFPNRPFKNPPLKLADLIRRSFEDFK